VEAIRKEQLSGELLTLARRQTKPHMKAPRPSLD